ncbi:MAG: hypothetical protein ACTHN5_24095 [Phycisphaerae bacterium]
MGLRDLNSIDIILPRPPFESEECKLVLIIIDATSDLPGGDAERYTLLLRKLTSYLAWVAGPAFAAEHPGLTPHDVLIRVLTVMPPTPQMLQIDAIKTKDQSTRLRVFFDDYHQYMAKIKGLTPHAPSSN